MIRSAVIGVSVCLGLGLGAQDVRSFKELSRGAPGCPRINDASVGAHRASDARPLKDAATDEMIARGARRSVAAFGVTDMEGKLATVAEQKGSIVVIGFWSTRCEPSMKMLQEFRNFQKQAALRGMKIVLWPVHFQPWSEVQSFLRIQQSYFEGVQVKRLGIGANGLSQLVNELDSLPTTFLVDKDGNLAAFWSGYQENLLLTRINGLLKER